jgi:hypothetical protein
MRSKSFSLFIEEFGEATSRSPVSTATVEKYRNILPETLLNIWKDEGWCSYRNGLLWIVNPEDYADLAEVWFRDTPLGALDNYYIFARSAFGVLYAWSPRIGQPITLFCPTHAIYVLPIYLENPSTNPELSMESFFLSASAKDFDFEADDGALLFERALERLGPLSPKSMYGFEPVLALGGQREAKSLRVVELQPHLSILRELQEPTMPFGGLDSAKLQRLLDHVPASVPMSQPQNVAVRRPWWKFW